MGPAFVYKEFDVFNFYAYRTKVILYDCIR